jgi:hypothetical protein
MTLAAVLHAPGDVRLEERPTPARVQVLPQVSSSRA